MSIDSVNLLIRLMLSSEDYREWVESRDANTC